MSDLLIPVNSTLTVNAGAWSVTIDDDGDPCRDILPPHPTMFEQLLAYIEVQPLLPYYGMPSISDVGIAVTALCIRWGSYFACLVGDKPLWRHAGEQDVSAISDGEMARINIESSAALAALFNIACKDKERFYRLVAHARQLLPMPQKKVSRDAEVFFAPVEALRALPELKQEGIWYTDREKDAREYPARVIANIMVNTCWRNGPIEGIHAGRAPDGNRPLLARRITPRDERMLMKSAARRFATAMLRWDPSLVAPAQMTDDAVVYSTTATLYVRPPSNWSLIELSRAVRLHGPEPLAERSIHR
jgi:hypothetical protein